MPVKTTLVTTKLCKHSDLTQETLKSLLRYDAATGLFTRVLPGKKVGHRHSSGYIKIVVCGLIFYAHRLAWLYSYGEWPKGTIDHDNRIKDDNRLLNLKDATPLEQTRNQARSLSSLSSEERRLRRNAQSAKCRKKEQNDTNRAS